MYTPACMPKKTTEQFIIDARIIHGDYYVYDKVDYQGSHVNVIITCPIHGDFLQAPTTHLSKGGCGCRKCGNINTAAKRRRSIKQYKLDVYDVHGDDLSVLDDTYINTTTHMNLKCNRCDHRWSSLPLNTLRGKGCPKCCGRIRSHDDYCKLLISKGCGVVPVDRYINTITKIKHKCGCGSVWLLEPNKLISGGVVCCPDCSIESAKVKTSRSHEEYLGEVDTISGTINVLGIYINAVTKIKHQCCECNHKWSVAPMNILTGYGCPACAAKKRGETLKMSEDTYKSRIREIHHDTVMLDGCYKCIKTKTAHKCDKGHKWNTTPNSVLAGCGCPVCKESRGEKKVRLFLNRHNIDYTPQYRTKDCKLIKPLPFDFRIIFGGSIVLIEYQGMQHYKPVNIFGGVKAFKQQQKKDRIKRKYCKDNGYKLIEIKYDQNVEEVLTEALGLNYIGSREFLKVLEPVLVGA